MKKGFLVPAALSGVRTLADKGMSLTFKTKELSPKEALKIMESHNLYGWVLFAENEAQYKDLPKGDAEDGRKTPSQRLRATLFVYWKQLGSQGDFEVFYRDMMEKFIDHIKSKLD